MIRCAGLHKAYPGKRVLSGVDLAIAPGQRLGVLGGNGAGKTTLIKLIAGVEQPSAGSVRRAMTVSWPLGFGGGFQGSLTGYDNARFLAAIYGRDEEEVCAFVAGFSELGRDLARAVKTYSAGMRARLAIALSFAIEFDCYLIDEVLLVGDEGFQRKCHRALFEERAGRALVLASHSAETIRAHCDSAIVLAGGKAQLFGDVEAALAAYRGLVVG